MKCYIKISSFLLVTLLTAGAAFGQIDKDSTIGNNTETSQQSDTEIRLRSDEPNSDNNSIDTPSTDTVMDNRLNNLNTNPQQPDTDPVPGENNDRTMPSPFDNGTVIPPDRNSNGQSAPSTGGPGTSANNGVTDYGTSPTGRQATGTTGTVGVGTNGTGTLGMPTR